MIFGALIGFALGLSGGFFIGARWEQHTWHMWMKRYRVAFRDPDVLVRDR